MISSGEKLTTNRSPVLFQRFNVCTEIKLILILILILTLERLGIVSESE